MHPGTIDVECPKRIRRSVIDNRNGRVTNANFAEYAVPVHADAPPVMDVIFVDKEDLSCP
ncbi:hypothetical protein CIT26_08020 [Mesorhizobium temperatum]|uniref:Uncharacterized protein n=1 Tax=Mesorhizobium temperatum TaxID=241416 RepID=A0A271LQT3_9HYPH|nr:hypothetical protein CIT26_08020 [Mesorhizobium temperatum]